MATGFQRAIHVVVLSGVASGVAAAAPSTGSVPPSRASRRAAGSGGYRGIDQSGRYEGAGLLKEWPKEGPRLLWKHPTDQGYAGVTVADGKVYIASGLASHLYVFGLDIIIRQRGTS